MANERQPGGFGFNPFKRQEGTGSDLVRARQGKEKPRPFLGPSNFSASIETGGVGERVRRIFNTPANAPMSDVLGVKRESSAPLDGPGYGQNRPTNRRTSDAQKATGSGTSGGSGGVGQQDPRRSIGTLNGTQVFSDDPRFAKRYDIMTNDNGTFFMRGGGFAPQTEALESKTNDLRQQIWDKMGRNPELGDRNRLFEKKGWDLPAGAQGGATGEEGGLAGLSGRLEAVNNMLGNSAAPPQKDPFSKEFSAWSNNRAVLLREQKQLMDALKGGRSGKDYAGEMALETLRGRNEKERALLENRGDLAVANIQAGAKNAETQAKYKQMQSNEKFKALQEQFKSRSGVFETVAQTLLESAGATMDSDTLVGKLATIMASLDASVGSPSAGLPGDREDSTNPDHPKYNK